MADEASAKEKSPREKLVSPRFIDRWAKRYMEKESKEGRNAAIAYGNSFLNVEDAVRIGERVRELRRNFSNKPS